EEDPRGDRAGQCEPERVRRGEEPVQRHRHGAVELLPELADDVVFLEHLDGWPEEIPEQHRADGEQADEHRGNRERDEWQRHDRRTFVRSLVTHTVIQLTVMDVLVARDYVRM